MSILVLITGTVFFIAHYLILCNITSHFLLNFCGWLKLFSLVCMIKHIGNIIAIATVSYTSISTVAKYCVNLYSYTCDFVSQYYSISSP